MYGMQLGYPDLLFRQISDRKTRRFFVSAVCMVSVEDRRYMGAWVEEEGVRVSDKKGWVWRRIGANSSSMYLGVFSPGYEQV